MQIFLRNGRDSRLFRLVLSGLFFFSACCGAFAQASAYTFSQSVGTFTPIAGGTQQWATPAGTGAAPDDNTVNNVALGFTFVYNGTNYTTVSITNNGYIMLGNGASTITSTNYSGLNGSDNNIISANGRDLQLGWRTTGTRTSGSTSLTAMANTGGINIGDNISGAGIASGAVVTAVTATTVTMSLAATSSGSAATLTFGGEVRTQLLGSAPNRTFVIQALKTRAFGSTGSNSRLDFQIRLNETSNVVDIIYGNAIYSSTSTTTSVGLRGASNLDFNARQTASPHDFNATTAATAITNTITTNITGGTAPVNGRTFTWTPPPPVCVVTPVGGTISGPASGVLGQNLTFTVSGNAANVQWQSSPDNITFTDIPGAISATQAIFSSAAGTFYLRNRANGAFCTDAFSNVLTVTIDNLGNTACAPAPLAFGTNGPFNSNAYTIDPGEPAPPAGGCSLAGNWCNPNTLFRTGWYSFVAPASGRVIVQTPSYDTQLAVWSATDPCNYTTFTLVAANDDDPNYIANGGVNFSSYIAIDCPSLVPGQTYYVQVDPYSSSGVTGSTTIILTDPGVIDATFSGLSSVCIPAAVQTLTPAAGTGTFSGPGISGNTFNPAVAGLGVHTITYTREAPFSCYTSSQNVTVTPSGCTDSAACNYNAAATCDDGSCVFPGCNNAAACNYNPAAGCDDGSCVFPGCIDAAACNYVPAAGCDDGSCVFPGCTDPQAANYIPAAGCDDGSCFYSDGDLTTNAASIGSAAFPACSNSSHSLAGLTDSPESAAVGPDKWLSLVAGTTAVSIELNVNGAVEAELLSSALVSVGSLSIAGAGTYNFNVTGLTEGDTYLLSLTDIAASGVNANVCSRYVPDTRCDYGPGPYTLCNSFKADWIGSVQYVFNFTSTTTAATYTRNNGTSTFCLLSSVTGLTYGDTYDVRIDAIWNIGGSPVTVTGNEICSIVVSAQPNTVLRPTDSCSNGPRLLGQSIAAQPFVCGAIDWKWEFTRTDVPELPIVLYRGSNNRFIRLNTIPGLVPGGTYDVRVAPVFGYGDGAYGSVACLSIVGAGGMTEQSSDSEVTAQIKLDETAATVAMIYPNPSNGDMVNLFMENLTDDVVVVDVIDMFGRVVFAQQYTVEGALNTVITFDNQLAGGMYLVNIYTHEGVITERLMVQK